ncbi:hypothetical protein WSS15_11580 [Acetobacter pasteurianus]|uniref:flagellar hook-basal body complex protein FliE n=1 Tax=Acetobacter pasteurianus TaxID=438 RepID=UPI0022C5D620|nr:flagellar hook-basal body complex protein FliE [Acetobacter pasteurianus]GLH28508.1 hypothetical protein WSS15_11580 [Acetobacter pasteurianus]
MSIDAISSLSSTQGGGALSAYRKAQDLLDPNLSTEQNVESSGDAVSSFSQVLEGAISGAIATGKSAENQTALALSGKGNMADVAAAVEEAKLSLQTTTVLRDKFVSSYQEVMRMSI